MLQNLISKKTVRIDDIVIDHPQVYDTVQSFCDSEDGYNTGNRVEILKKSILEKGFVPLGLAHINERKEMDHPYLLRSLADSKCRGMSGRIHRTLALKFLNAEGKISEAEIFLSETIKYPDDFKSQVDFRNDYGGFQKINLADKAVIAGRDDVEKDYWQGFGVNDYFWLDKSVLDVACNIGAWSFMALERGASEVKGFDVNSSAIYVANRIKNALSLPRISFLQSTFEDYVWDKKFDVAFLNQCLYHFKLPEGEAFQRISNYADFLFMYTFMINNPEGDPNLGTYIPTIDKLKRHLVDAGFNNIILIAPPNVIRAIKDRGLYGGKINIVAFKDNIAAEKMKYFRFFIPYLEYKGFVLGVFSGELPPFLRWYLGEELLDQYVVMAKD